MKIKKQITRKIAFIAAAAGAVLCFNHALHSEIHSGLVRDYNKIEKTITVTTAVPGEFPPGQVALIYHNNREIGKMKVQRGYHTKVVGKLVPGTAGDIPRNSIVVKSAGDFSKMMKMTRDIKVSYQGLAGKARGWGVSVEFSGAACSKDNAVQTRKIDLPNTIGIREKGQDFYSPLHVDTVDTLVFEWDGTKMSGRSVKLKNKKIVACDELLAASVFDRLKPPSECRGDNQRVSIILKKPGAVSPKQLEPVVIKLESMNPEKTFGKGKVWLLKMYANSEFIEEFLLKGDLLSQPSIDREYYIPVYLMSPGKNSIEFYFVEAEEVTGDYLEKGDYVKAGKRNIIFGEDSLKHEFRLSGKSGKFPVLN